MTKELVWKVKGRRDLPKRVNGKGKQVKWISRGKQSRGSYGIRTEMESPACMLDVKVVFSVRTIRAGTESMEHEESCQKKD